MSKITPCLWFDGNAEEAATFYADLFADASIGAISRYGPNMPFPEGTAMMVEFTLFGQSFQGLNGGPQFPFTEAVSLSVSCTDQAEVDRYWNALIANGGAPSQCGWLKDRFGLSWQIVPDALGRLMAQGGPGAGAMMGALMQMTKLDIAALERAYVGEDA